MDDLGRSVLSRVIHAYRVSLGVAMAAALLALLIGGPLGLVAGYAEGLPDQLIMRPLDVLMAFPAILLAIALMSVFGTGAVLVAVALAVVYTPIVARVVRAAVLATKVEVYVDGARALGASVPRLVLSHIVPNAATPVLVQASVLMAIAHPGRGRAVVPRRGRAPADAVARPDARRRAQLHAAGARGWCLPRPGHHARRAGLQHARRWPARLAGSGLRGPEPPDFFFFDR